MATGLSLTTDLRQTTKLSPAQIQVIRMLEIPAVELQQRITEEIQENPLLEIVPESEKKKEEEQSEYDEDYLYKDDEPEETDDYNRDDDFLDPNADYQAANDSVDMNDAYTAAEWDEEYDMPNYKTETQNYSPDDDREEIPFSVGTTFMEYLNEQIGQQKISERERAIAEYVIGNIDDNGWLTRTAEQLVDDLAFRLNIEVSDEEMIQIVDIIRSLDPPGVGAFNLQDCLLLQIKRQKPSETTHYATTILEKYFEEFHKRHFDRIQQRLGLDDDQMKSVMQEISKLNPKPGNSFGGTLYESNVNQVTPDFFISSEDGQLTISINTGDIPDLRISQEYQGMLNDLSENRKNKGNRDGIRFIKQHIDNAKWFIDAIRQRNETMIRTMEAIVRFQHDYFVEGDESYLKPMILQDIAEMTGYDVSTISRVSNAKYVQTDFGMFPLKHFFSEGLVTESGDEVSTREIKKVLKEVIDKEDKRHPLNDDQLVQLLRVENYKVARRTVAKYRELLGIPVARLRKEV